MRGERFRKLGAGLVLASVLAGGVAACSEDSGNTGLTGEKCKTVNVINPTDSNPDIRRQHTLSAMVQAAELTGYYTRQIGPSGEITDNTYKQLEGYAEKIAPTLSENEGAVEVCGSANASAENGYFNRTSTRRVATLPLAQGFELFKPHERSTAASRLVFTAMPA